MTGDSATPRDLWHLGTHIIGRRVLVFDKLDSTNTAAARFSDDSANHGLAILAEEQTAGRGQHGRAWLSPAVAAWRSIGVLLAIADAAFINARARASCVVSV